MPRGNRRGRGGGRSNRGWTPYGSTPSDDFYRAPEESQSGKGAEENQEDKYVYYGNTPYVPGSTCKTCYGTKNCQICKGSGKSGGGGICQICSGSAVCNVCKGIGKEPATL